MQKISKQMIKIDTKLLQDVTSLAQQHPRKRMNHNFHEKAEDTIQRMLNAMEPLSYVQPHKHENPDKREVFIVFTGKALVVEFDDNGNITEHTILDPKNGIFGCEIKERVYHCIISIEKGTVAYEVKDGPYVMATDKNFAPWAPKEGEPGCREYLLQMFEKLSIKIEE